MNNCSQCGVENAADSAAYCAQCGSRIEAEVGVLAPSSEPTANPYAVGVENSARSGRFYDPVAPNIPGFYGAIAACFRKYCQFKGRASRSEFWHWFLFVSIVNFGINQVAVYDVIEASNAFFCVIYGVWFLIIFLPTLAVYVRRLHDLDYSGLILLKSVFIAFSLGVAVVVRGKKIPEGLTLVFFTFCVVNMWIMATKCCRRGTDGENQFGLAPQKRKKT